jgi:hypothetical protein
VVANNECRYRLVGDEANRSGRVCRTERARPIEQFESTARPSEHRPLMFEALTIQFGAKVNLVALRGSSCTVGRTGGRCKRQILTDADAAFHRRGQLMARWCTAYEGERVTIDGDPGDVTEAADPCQRVTEVRLPVPASYWKPCGSVVQSEKSAAKVEGNGVS